MNLTINSNLTLTIAADHRQAMYAEADRRRLRRLLRAAPTTVDRTTPVLLSVAPLSSVAERPATISAPHELEHTSARVA